MVSYKHYNYEDKDCLVLILVVVEDGLVLDLPAWDEKRLTVLILVVVEDGLVLVIEVQAPDGTKRS